ncbi:MAG: ABC transporter ATP-binding protein [Acidimicrobiales bacterium]
MGDRTSATTEAETETPVEVGVQDVVKRFGEALAVDHVTLEVHRGEFFSFLGPSGCGKTTTLRLIAGFEEADSGRIILSGNDIDGVPPYRRNVNTVFQSYALFPHLSVWDNVAFGLRRKKQSKPAVRERVGHYLELVELSGMEHRRPGQLSGGQQQRVALARALVNEPAVLLLDEPLGALDLKLRKQMQLELMRIQREVGITFVYVTHDQEEALVMSDRLVVMRRPDRANGLSRGRVRATGNAIRRGFIGTSNIFARVSDRNGDNLLLDVAEGDRILVPVVDGAILGAGDIVAVTVRPEKLTMVDEDAAVSEGLCSVGGTIVEVVYQGVSTQYIVRTNAGDTIVAFRQNSERVRDAGGPGSRARLVWEPQHNVVLAEESLSRPPVSEPQEELVS